MAIICWLRSCGERGVVPSQHFVPDRSQYLPVVDSAAGRSLIRSHARRPFDHLVVLPGMCNFLKHQNNLSVLYHCGLTKALIQICLLKALLPEAPQDKTALLRSESRKAVNAKRVIFAGMPQKKRGSTASQFAGRETEWTSSIGSTLEFVELTTGRNAVRVIDGARILHNVDSDDGHSCEQQ
jgi:hypothetical protein